MKTLLLYLLQVIIASGILYGYYHFMLKNKKFHQYNRFYLLGAAVISILIPFLRIPVYFTESATQSSVVLQTLQNISFSTPGNDITAPVIYSPVASASFDWNIVWYAVYALAALLLLARVLVSLKKIKTIIKNNVVEELNGVHFVNTAEPGTPYSFFRWLFWNNQIELGSEKGEQIFRHEIYHIQQKHSLDILFMEFLSVLFWINPFFHLVKKEMKAIHEFLADRFAANEAKKWDYAELLLMQALNTQQQLVNPFFHNQIKRRIAMITDPQKTSYKYLRKLLVLPVAAIVVTLFAFKYKSHTTTPALTLSAAPVTIVVDAGHGGNDPGATSSDQKYSEAVLALEIAKDIQRLAKEYNVNVVMTREDDHFPGNVATKEEGLRKRVEITDEVKPAAFISIHVNSQEANMPVHSGFEAYLATRKDDPESRRLATTILQNVSSVYSVNAEPKQRPERGIYVLDHNDYPAVILQCGYITNAKDLAFITNPANQEKIARNILAGVVRYQQPVTEASFLVAGKNNIDSNPVLRLREIEKPHNNPVLNLNEIEHTDSVPSFQIESLLKCLVVIDGSIDVKINGTNLNENINIDNIRSINILKGSTAIAKYGEKGKYGVIEIHTKDASPVTELHLKEIKEPKVEELHLQEIKEVGDNKLFTKVEIDPTFPGGAGAWKKYLSKNINASIPVDKGAPTGTYTTYVQFLVHSDGNISDIKALTNHGFGMEEEVIRIIKNGPRWLPAIQNGKKVNAYKKQPVTFQVEEADNKKPVTANRLPEVVLVAYLPDNTKTQQASFSSINELTGASGGSSEWRKFLERNVDPNSPIREGWGQGTYQVLIQFTQNEDGTLSELTALNSQGSKTAAHCIDVLKHIHKMTVDASNAGVVKKYFIQPFTFMIEKDPNRSSI
jgi:N-acetylmuramoyl-L-alanine amidase